MEPGTVWKRVARLAGAAVAAAMVIGCGPTAPERVQRPPAKPEGDSPIFVERKSGQSPTRSLPEPKATGEPPKSENAPESKTPAATADEPPAEKPLDLGPPLVDGAEGLRKLDPDRPVWIDGKHKRVVMVGQVCQRTAPLEMFACLRETKEYESLVSVDVRAAVVHAGLLALGAQPGHPVQFMPDYAPATGTEIEVTVAWKDKTGKRQTARAQEWVLDAQTQKAMTNPWVFAGSGFWVDENTGEKRYQAEGGDFICVSNFTTAMLDLPIKSSQANAELMFQPFTERVPPLGTPVTLILTPKLEKKTDR